MDITFQFNTTGDSNTSQWKDSKFILSVLLFVFWINKQICPNESNIQKVKIKFNVETTLQIEFKQNSFNLVECHTKKYIDLKKFWLASQYYMKTVQQIN